MLKLISDLMGSGALRLDIQGVVLVGVAKDFESDDFRHDARSVFDVMPVLNPADKSIYAEMGISLNRYRYGKLMIEAVDRGITIRELVIELIDRHIDDPCNESEPT